MKKSLSNIGKYGMKRILFIFTFVVISGCVSSLIDHSAGKYKNVFIERATITSIREELGNPTSSYTKGEPDQKPEFSINSFHSYEVFDVTGKIHKPGDGAMQATVNAVTLGIGELLLLPYTVVKVTGEAFESHTLVVFYNQ